jgi:Arc/MetJ-type ribon-helix-helix transcriptional regulator
MVEGLVVMTDPREAQMTDLATDPIIEPAVDADLLAEARRQIQATSANEAINEGLRLLVERERAKRRAARARLEQMHDEGVFDYSQLDAADE